VALVTPRLVQASGGKYLDGDRLVEKISATYTSEQLGGGTTTSLGGVGEPLPHRSRDVADRLRHRMASR
jgi:hypothetical protein